VPPGKHFGLVEAVGAVAEEGEQAEVTEHLELLTDFIADVAVGRMKFRQGVPVGINILQREFCFPQRLNHLKYVECQAAFFYF